MKYVTVELSEELANALIKDVEQVKPLSAAQCRAVAAELYNATPVVKQYEPVANVPIGLPWAIAGDLPTPIGTLNRNCATGDWVIHDPEGNQMLRFRMDDYEVCTLRSRPERAEQ
jgi:hypothetical protein